METLTTSWKTFFLKDLFECLLSKGDLKEGDCACGRIPLVSSGATNNGIVKYIDESGDGKAQMFKGNCLTLDMFCNCFYQQKDFFAVSHGRVNILIPKFDLNKNIGLFLVTIINLQQYKFSYGRAVYSSVAENIEIRLPVDRNNNKPDWNYMNDYIQELQERERESEGTLADSLKTSITIQPSSINTSEWKEFLMSELFSIYKGKRLTKEDMEEGNINFIGAIESNNGVREKIGNGYLFKGNCLTVNYNGSVGEAFYQQSSFWASDDVNVLELKNKKMNKYIGLFLCTIIKTQKVLYSYGRKWTLEKMKQTSIKLPVKNDLPDFVFMEQYIRTIPFSDRI